MPNQWAAGRKNWSEKSLVSQALASATSGSLKKSTSDGDRLVPANVLDAVTPWRLIPYAEQLERKQAEMVAVVSKIQKAAVAFNVSVSGQKRPRTEDDNHQRSGGDSTEKADQNLPSWLKASIAKGPLACPVAQIMSVPEGTEVAYRNKAQFTIGYDDANKPCVGYKVGSFSESQRIASPEGSTNLPKEIFTVVDVVQKWVSQSALPVYNQALHEGVWRQVSVRWSQKTGDIMVDLMAKPPLSVNPSSSSSSSSSSTLSSSSSSTSKVDQATIEIPTVSNEKETRQVYESEIARFIECVKALAGVGDIRSVNICMQEFNGVSSPEASFPHKYLHGEKYVLEKMCGLTFAVSPGAFFQVHTPAAERLYYLARALAIEGVKGGATYLNENPPKRDDLTILDVCCGTGTIGLICAPFVGKVIGVDIAKEAIEDAERNKALNGESVSNSEFMCGKAETLMKDIISLAQKESASGKAPTEVVAIVDPPRAGLHPDVIRALRTCRLLKRVVYVSCNPTGSLSEDAMKLCVPPRKGTSYASGPPFHPVHAYPFDLFPQTNHCEMVMVFERGGGGEGGTR
jgi:tRNA (uracil-5-)-methyltransferase